MNTENELVWLIEEALQAPTFNRIFQILKKLNGLSASLIVYSHQPAPFGRPFVNLDPDIISLLREISVLDKLQCPIPSFAKETLLKAKYIKYHYEQLKVGFSFGKLWRHF